jgi:hypothetical protein
MEGLHRYNIGIGLLSFHPGFHTLKNLYNPSICSLFLVLKRFSDQQTIMEFNRQGWLKLYRTLTQN